MAWDLYVEDGQAIPAIIIQDGGAPPAGYTLTNTIEAWGLNYASDVLNKYDYDFLRVRLRELLDAKTWAACSDEEKQIIINYYLYNQRKIVQFAGTGLDDFMATGNYSGGTADATYEVVIDGVGSPNTFKWNKDGGAYTTGVAITGSPQLLSDDISVQFQDTDNHTLNDMWRITCMNNNADTDKVAFLMSPAGGSMTQAEAQAYILSQFASSHKSSIECSITRVNADEIFTSVGTYLTIADAIDFFRKVRDLQIDFREQAILGSRWGSDVSGLGDYIMGIDGYGNDGLPAQGYVLKTGTMSDLQNALMDVLADGIYTKQ